jgi:hypothetical protein
VLAEPPAPGSEPDVGDNDKVTDPAAWVSANDANKPPANTTTEPDRAEDKGLTAAVSDNATPLAPDIRSTDTQGRDARTEEDTTHDA